MRRAYKNSANQSQKMLASTVQFSTYNQTPATHHRQTHTHPQAAQRYDHETALPRQRPPLPGRPVPSGPNSVPTNQTPTHHCFPHPEGPYSQRQTMPAELVSVPPLSTVTDTSSPSV